MRPSWLVLEDGSFFQGVSIGAAGVTTGEIIFNTAMTGYQEVLTDPSYAKQIVLFTAPHIGNTGINSDDIESTHTWVEGIILRELPIDVPHWRKTLSLCEYLNAQNVVGIAGVDTRSLTHLVRQKGSMKACIVSEEMADPIGFAKQALQQFTGINNSDLTEQVSTKKPYAFYEGSYVMGQGHSHASLTQPKKNVVVVDFGVKRNILRKLVDFNCKVQVVPASSTLNEVMAFSPAGVVLANGPGDPQACQPAIELAKGLMEAKIPLLGICLGHQIIALALGAKTYRMKFGQHGVNQPVQDLQTRRVFITSQNHNYAVDERTLPKNAEVTHVALFDGSLQGFKIPAQKIICFQGHPEASPGPHDIDVLFKQFIDVL